jgi:effector-binding domain-containing protein
MLEQPQIIQTETLQTATVRLRIPRSEIQNVMEPAIREVLAVLGEQGIAPIGPVFSNHFSMEPDIFDFEVGVPVATPIKPSGRVHPSALPSAPKVVQTVYTGPYEKLGEAWGEFMEWMNSKDLSYAPGLWERYLTGPESNPDPATWRTELNRRLLS